MPDMIRDGCGRGNLAAVGKKNRLCTSSRVNSRIYYISRDDKKAFSVHWASKQIVGSTVQTLGYLKYTGNGSLIINKIVLATEEAGMTKFGLWVDQTMTNGTGVAAVPVNLNRTSSLTSEITTFHNNNNNASTLSGTGGSSVVTVRLNGPATYEVDFDSSLILGINNIFVVTANPSTADALTRSFLLYYEESEYA